jgi:hypothetical protein
MEQYGCLKTGSREVRKPSLGDVLLDLFGYRCVAKRNGVLA